MSTNISPCHTSIVGQLCTGPSRLNYRQGWIKSIFMAAILTIALVVMIISIYAVVTKPATPSTPGTEKSEYNGKAYAVSNDGLPGIITRDNESAGIELS